jgi:hypothetical protein
MWHLSLNDIHFNTMNGYFFGKFFGQKISILNFHPFFYYNLFSNNFDSEFCGR